MHSYDYPLKPPLRKKSASVEIDRISNLSDDVICRILSFITPTKYCIRTRLLSRRWENLWALIPDLVLEFDQHYIRKYNEDPTYNRFKELYANTFINSVDNLLFLRDCLHIESFKLCFGRGVLPSRLQPSSWVCGAVMCNVRELDIKIEAYSTSDFGELPWCLFTCKTLVVLKLSGKFTLNVPYYVCLSNLKTLCLRNVVYVGEPSIQKLLSGCPILEDLEIIRDYWGDLMQTLNVDSSSLKNLKYRCRFDDDYVYPTGQDDDKIVVNVPNLEFIDFGDTWSNNIMLKPFPKINEAKIDISEGEERDKVLLLCSLFQSMVNVRRLFLSECTLIFLWNTMDPNLPTFYNLVHLELKYVSGHGPIHLMDFLCCSPKLEILSLPTGICSYASYSGLDSKFLENNPAQVPECLRHSLKTIEIRYFEGTKLEFNIVKYLLENALVLEKMTIYCQHHQTPIDVIQKKITNFPRLSTDCELVILYER